MERTPFGPLTEFQASPPGLFCINREAVNNPNVLVKEVVQLMRYPMQPNLDQHYDFAFFKEDAADPINALIADTSPIAKFIPPVFCVWGKNMLGEPKGFIVMRRVFGEDIQNISHINPDMAGLLDEAIAASFDVESPNPEYRLSVDLVQWDPLRPSVFHNIVIGSIADEKPQPYFVDLYPVRSYQGSKSFKTAHDRRISWTEAVRSLSWRSEGYQYPLSQAKFEAFMKVYEVQAEFSSILGSF